MAHSSEDITGRRICLTPTRNEAWIASRFVAATSCWADRIVVVDQNSSDGTVELLKAGAKVDVIANPSPVYDEQYRQRLLLERARTIPGKRILIALDADESLSANALQSKDWQRINDAAPGTVLRFRWVNVLPGFRKVWIPTSRIACGFVDDGTFHTGERIHSRRIPWPDGAPVLDLDDIVVLHFQYILEDRVASKQRWYQAWERLNHPSKSALDIFRQYHHMQGSWSSEEIYTMRTEWLDGYTALAIDFRNLTSEPVKWWDRDLLAMLVEHGSQKFSRTDIWDVDWTAIARTLGAPTADVSDPRSIAERLAHRLLNASQAKRGTWSVRVLERALRAAGW